MFFLVVLVVGALLSSKKLLPDHMFSAFTNEWWPHMDPTFMPMCAPPRHERRLEGGRGSEGAAD